MKRKAVSCLLVLAAIMTMTPTIPTLAAENPDNTTQEVTTTGTQGATITYEQDSAFTVTIPKTITLGQNKSATYDVKVKGDISGNETVTVTPDATLQLTDSNGKAAVTGTITQDITEFAADQVNLPDGGSTTGNIVANDLTSGDWSGNFEFAINTNQIGDGIALTNSNLSIYQIDTVGAVVIPEYVTDNDNTRHAVTSIGDYAFRDCDEMTSVAIADSVTEIGTGAFANCSKLSNVSLPTALKTVKYNVFEGCSNLSVIQYKENSYDKIDIGSALTENDVTIDSELFEHTYGEPTYVWSEDGQTCTAKRTCVNHHSSIETEEATVSSSVKEEATCTTKGITTYTATFTNSRFTTQTKDIPDIEVLGHNPVDGYCTRCNERIAGLYDADGKMVCTWEESGIHVSKNFTFDNYKTDTVSAYSVLQTKPEVRSIVIPDSVTYIGDSVFCGCSGLKSIIIPDSVKDIGWDTFSNCSALTSITIPDSVTSIGMGAFEDCTSLKSITIPDSVTSIEVNTFRDCSGLTSITLSNSVTNIGGAAFSGCSALTSITIPDSVTSIGVTAFENCTGLTSITIPDSVTSIGNFAFHNCTNLASITYKSQTYTNKSALTTALKNNNVTVETKAFNNTKLQ